MTALKRSLEIKLENILLLKIWQLVGHLLKFKSLYQHLRSPEHPPDWIPSPYFIVGLRRTSSPTPKVFQPHVSNELRNCHHQVIPATDIHITQEHNHECILTESEEDLPRPVR